MRGICQLAEDMDQQFGREAVDGRKPPRPLRCRRRRRSVRGRDMESRTDGRRRRMPMTGRPLGG